ncbi:MAG: hypothetical protein IPN69_08405 [Acidobacteria bacterium]|nr:hypothetical protein [Acidobacteriota bacterium]
MNWAKLKFLLIDFGFGALAFAVKYWYLIVALVLFIVIGGYIQSCRRDSLEKKIDRIEGNITEQNVIGNILANEKANINGEVNRSEQNTNNARRDLDNSRRTDSGVFTGNSEDKFCRKFPNDSSCFEWRKRHPEVMEY